MLSMPIAHRELLLASRRPRTYYRRIGVVLGAVFFTSMMGWGVSKAAGKVAGGMMLQVWAQYLAMYMLFGGVAATSDSLSSEKREGTLGLLFLTDLNAWDVVSGKLVAGSLQLAYGLLGALPVMGLMMTFGGVPLLDFVQLCLGLANALFFAVCAGLFISSISQQKKRAEGAGSMLMVLFCFVLPGLTQAMVFSPTLRPLARWLSLFNPAQIMRGNGGVFPPGMATTSFSFLSWLVSIQAMSWVLLGLTCLILPRVWQDKAGRTARTPWREKWRRWTEGPPAKRLAHRARLLQINPYHWLTSRNPHESRVLWFWCAVAASAAGLFLAKVPNAPFEVAAVMCAIFCHMAIKMRVSAKAAEQVSTDRANGALELLLSTPISVREICAGHWQTLRRGTLGPMVALLAVELLLLPLLPFLPTAMPMRGANAVKVLEIWLPLTLAAGTMLVLDFITMGWLGMWYGVSSPSRAKVQSMVVWRVFLLPWISFGLLAALIGGKFGVVLEFWQVAGLWTVWGVLFDYFWICRAWANIGRHFREKATTQFMEEESLWVTGAKWLRKLVPAKRPPVIAR